MILRIDDVIAVLAQTGLFDVSEQATNDDALTIEAVRTVLQPACDAARALAAPPLRGPSRADEATPDAPPFDPAPGAVAP